MRPRGVAESSAARYGEPSVLFEPEPERLGLTRLQQHGSAYLEIVDGVGFPGKRIREAASAISMNAAAGNTTAPPTTWSASQGMRSGSTWQRHSPGTPRSGNPSSGWSSRSPCAPSASSVDRYQ